MKRPKGWMALTDQDKFNTVLKCYQIYKGDYKKIAHHIFISMGGTTTGKISRDLVRLIPHVKTRLQRDETKRFDHKRHVSLPNIGQKKYVYDTVFQELVDLDQKKPDQKRSGL